MNEIVDPLYLSLTSIISDTNGVTVNHTLRLLLQSGELRGHAALYEKVSDFYDHLLGYQQGRISFEKIFQHEVSHAFEKFFRSFPQPYHEEHIHLTGSMTPDFIQPRLERLLSGEHSAAYMTALRGVYGELPQDFSVQNILSLLTLKDDERFHRYLQILLIPKLVLQTREDHHEAAYGLAKRLFEQQNVGFVRLKFTYHRSASEASAIKGVYAPLSSDDVVLGLYSGFKAYKLENPIFDFVLSPSFRKEKDFFDSSKFKTKEDEFSDQVDSLLSLLQRYPELEPYVTDVDTVGDEKGHFRKEHFEKMKVGLRKLNFRGFRIRSHHGETWNNLTQGVQSVDNALNIWHIDTLEHGLSLGVNPHVYYHTLFQKSLEQSARPLVDQTLALELQSMPWRNHSDIYDCLIKGSGLTQKQKLTFTKIKFHHAREVEHYQHDVLNRMIDKKVSLTALPSSNKKLTDYLPGYQDHPFSWWEKKGVRLGIGTDNDVAINTHYIKELLILLFSDPELKISKLLRIATKENRRPKLSSQLFEMKYGRLS